MPVEPGSHCFRRARPTRPGRRPAARDRERPARVGVRPADEGAADRREASGRKPGGRV